MKLLFFDLETTGTNPGRNGIHQISGQVVIDGIVKESFDFHVQPNPKAAIEDEALAVAGVTREQIAQYPAMGTVYRQFVAMLGKYVDKYNSKDKFFLVGYNNAAFDKFTFTENAFALTKGLCRDIIGIEKRIQFGLEYVTKWAKSINIDLDWHIDEKMKYNATRPPKHGKAY